MKQFTEYLESYQIFLYAGGVTILLICAWVIIARQKETINSLVKENIRLRYKLTKANNNRNSEK